MAETPGMVGGGATQIPIASGVGGSAPTPQGTGQAGGQQAGLQTPQPTQSGWIVSDPELSEMVKTKGWKSDTDALRSYRELEKKFGEVTGNSSELEKIVNAVAPYWDDFMAWQSKQAEEAAQAGQANKKTQAFDPSALKEHFKPFEDQLNAVNQRQASFARQTASQRFESEHKDAIELKERIVEILKSGVVQTRDQYDPNACYQTLVAAYNMAKSERADKAEKGKLAGRAEGGSGGENSLTGNDMTREQMRAVLQG